MVWSCEAFQSFVIRHQRRWLDPTTSSNLRFKRFFENAMNLKIGLLAEQTGTTVPTIRYYEEIGLLPRANRGHGGQRSYGEEDVGRLTFIRRCRDFGFSVEQVRTLTQLMRDPDRSCVEARDLAWQHLSRVRAKLGEFKA